MRRLFPTSIALALCALALAGCGFKPMYGAGTGVSTRLSGIEVRTDDGRDAYLVGVALRDRLGSWQGERALYTLETRTSLTRTSTALTIDQVASRILLGVSISYGLYDRASGDMLAQGSVTGQATYDVPIQPYAAIRAEQDSTERAANDAADRLTLALARYFDSPPEAETP